MSRALARPLVTAVLAAALAAAVPAPALAAGKRPAKAAKPAKPAPRPRPVRYVVVGTLASLDGSSITLASATGGNAKPGPGPVTLAVAASAKVVRDDAPATLASLLPGDHVAASGTRTGTTVTITKVIATSPEPELPDAEPDPAESYEP